MGTLLRMARWLLIAVLGISGLGLMVAPALAQREMSAARTSSSHLVGLPEAQTTAAASTGSQASTNPTESEIRVGSEVAGPRLSTTTQAGRSHLPQPRVQDSVGGSVGDLLGLALLILGFAVALHSWPRPRIEYTPHQGR